jgi:redox-sensitive bicupin YhaK (pirin superfamily)
MLYVFGGDLQVNGKNLHDGQLGLLTQGDSINIQAGKSGAELLLLAGPELNEPIARYGPFVMNTREEIHQAILDYQNGTLA